MCVCGGGGGGGGWGWGGWVCVCVDIINRKLVAPPFQSIYFRTINLFPDFFFAKIIVATTEATSMKTVPNESKLIYAIKFLIVASWCLL